MKPKEEDEEDEEEEKNEFNPMEFTETFGEKKLKKLLADVTILVEFIGFVEPMNKVYLLSKDVKHFALACALLTLSACS